MRELWPFLKAVGRVWWALMSCAAFTILCLYSGFTHRDEVWLFWANVALAVLMIFIASFVAWRKEYLKNIGGAEIQIAWRSGESASFTTVHRDVIEFHSRGADDATKVVVGAFSRTDLAWVFPIEIASLAPGEKRVIEAHFQKTTGIGSGEVGYMKEILQESREAITIPVRYSNRHGATYLQLFTLRLVDAGRLREIACEASAPRLTSRR